MNNSRVAIPKWLIIGAIIVFVIYAVGSCESKKTTSYSSSSSYKSKSSYSSSYSGGSGSYSGGVRKKAMTKEEAERLRGTGYHGTRPNSSAENTELAAAQNVCSNCGYHTEYGSNSICQYCRDHGVR